MLTVPMSQSHSSPFQLGSEQLEQLAPPRTRSTSPFSRLRGLNFRAKTPPPPSADNNEGRPNISRPMISSPLNMSKEELHMLPPPLRPASRQSRPPLSSESSSSGEGPTLQPDVYSKAPPGVMFTLQPVAYERPPPPREEPVLQPVTYSRPLQRRHQGSPAPPQERFVQAPQSSIPRSSIPQDDEIRRPSVSSITSSAPASPWASEESIKTPRQIPEQKTFAPPTRKSTFVNPTDFGLFAEALSGMGPEPATEPMMQAPFPASAALPLRQDSIVSPLTPEETHPYFGSRTSSARSAAAGRSYGTYPPSSAPASRSVTTNPPISAFEPPAFISGSTFAGSTAEDFALSGTMMGLSMNDDDDLAPPPDDELPDYEQSQREAADQARRKASNRAAELEQRWARSAPHRR